jgi:hypothetical protein
MHQTALITSLSLNLVAAPAERGQQVDNEHAPLVAMPDDDFLAGLQAPIPLDVRHGAALDVSYDIGVVGRVSITVDAQDDRSGRGRVMVGDAVVVEVEVIEGAVVSEAVDLSALTPSQVHAVAASVLQVWHEPAVTAVLGDRAFKCTVAGGIAGATAGVLVFAACGVFIKKPKCVGAGYGAYHKAWGYIADKCNGAQNK